MDWQYCLKPPRPCWMFRLHAAMWSTFTFFLERADAFTLECGAWGQEDLVQPILDLGYAPEPTPSARWLCRLGGPLTPAARQALLGPGGGQFPWWSLELYRDGRPIYSILEHEQDVFWNCTPEELQALCRSLDPVLVGKFAHRYLPEPAQVGASLLAAALARRAGGQAGGEEVRCFDTRCIVDMPGGAGTGRLRLESDPTAAAMVAGEAAAEAIASQLDPPPVSGDYLRLSLANGTPVLSRMPPALWPRLRRFTHRLNAPEPAQWRRAVAVSARRADRFALRWHEFSPPDGQLQAKLGSSVIAANLDVDGQGGVEELVGLLTPRALHLLLTELPPIQPPLRHEIPSLPAGNGPAEPYVELLLLAGQEVVLQSDPQGITLSPTPEEAALIDRPPGRLGDLAVAQTVLQRLNRAWMAMERAADRLVTAEGDPGFYQFRSEYRRYHEVRYRGRVVFTLTVEPDALDRLAGHPDPAALIADLPRGGHILVETDRNLVRWREVPEPPYRPPWRGREPDLHSQANE